ncbi:MAG: glutathione peroxidase [Bacteroidales bacterium]|nr:glutathione peroxidase [Bacteroidales bacterium]
MKIYDFNVINRDKTERSLRDFEGKVLLVVNTATSCGFTPQYDELEALYAKYKDKGFEILDFPCNQFGGQAKGSDEEIHLYCQLRFQTRFTRFAKTEVNGRNQNPLFLWLKSQLEFRGFNPSDPVARELEERVSKIDPDYKHNSDIKWNFTKFLIDRHGDAVERFEPPVTARYIEPSILRLL